jgi:transcriptional regulator with XRE-family HTH domain
MRGRCNLSKSNLTMINKPLAKNIRTARKKKDESQEKTARKLGIKQKTYAKYEEGRSYPKPELLKIILEYFDIKEEDMYPFVYNENFWQ